MQFLLLTPVRHASLCHAQWAEKVVKLESVNLEFVFICYFIGQTVKVNLECAEPARCVWLLRKLAPILQSVHTDRCVRPPTILTVLLLLKCLCVRARSTFSSSSRTLAVGSTICFDCSVCNGQKYELQTLVRQNWNPQTSDTFGTFTAGCLW